MQSISVLALLAALATSAEGKVSVANGCWTITNLEECCNSIDGRTGSQNQYNGQECVPTAALVAGQADALTNTAVQFYGNHVCQPACFTTLSCASGNPPIRSPQAAFIGQCMVPTTTPAATTTPAPTTTSRTPWDSSASSSDSDSLDSSWSSSFHDASDSSASFADSSVESSGSDASGSSGSYMFIWQWLILLTCCCCVLMGVVVPMLMKKKKKAPKKPTGPAKTTLASDHPAGCTYLEVTSQAGFKAGDIIEIDAGSPLAEIQEVSGLGSILLTQPLTYPHPLGAPVQVTNKPKAPAEVPVVQTTSAVIPSYSMVQTAPLTSSYAAPVSYAAAPATTAFAAPTTYAAPMSYAAPTTAYASPTTYAAPLMGGTTSLVAPGYGV